MVLFINLVFKRVIVLEILSCGAVVHESADDDYVDRLTNPQNLTNYIRKVVKWGEFLSDFLFGQSK